MLKIRQEQLDAHASGARHEANKQLSAYARKRFPSEFSHTPHQQLYDFAESVRKSAERYGINKENDVGTFLDFTVMYGKEFEHAAWAADALRAEALYGPDKMSLLRSRVEDTGVEL